MRDAILDGAIPPPLSELILFSFFRIERSSQEKSEERKMWLT